MGVLLKAVFDIFALHIAIRAELLHQCIDAFNTARIEPALPHMAKDGFADITIRLAIDSHIASDGEPEQRQRVERVTDRHLQRYVQLVRQPQHLPISPVALGCNLSRAKLPKVLEHACKQHGSVRDAVTDAFECFRQLLKRQVRVGRYEVEVKGDVLQVA